MKRKSVKVKDVHSDYCDYCHPNLLWKNCCRNALRYPADEEYKDMGTGLWDAMDWEFKKNSSEELLIKIGWRKNPRTIDRADPDRGINREAYQKAILNYFQNKLRTNKGSVPETIPKRKDFGPMIPWAIHKDDGEKD